MTLLRRSKMFVGIKLLDDSELRRSEMLFIIKFKYIFWVIFNIEFFQ